MGKSDDSWSLKEYQRPNSREVSIFRKNLAPTVEPGSSSHQLVCYLTFGYKPRDDSGLPSALDEERLVNIEKRELPALEEHGLSVLVGVVVRGGVKDFIFYAREAEEFLERASRIRDAHPEFRLGCEVGANASWSHYEDLP
jgi:hypothetical protein